MARGSRAGGAWGNGVHEAVVKVLQCPSEPSPNAGICSTGAKGWSGSSYAPNCFLFASDDLFDESKGVNITQSRYLVTALPNGSENTVAAVERYACFPTYGWS